MLSDLTALRRGRENNFRKRNSSYGSPEKEKKKEKTAKRKKREAPSSTLPSAGRGKKVNIPPEKQCNHSLLYENKGNFQRREKRKHP